MTPLFSIIIPVYRVEAYLRDCLLSLQNQTFSDWECICIDDGSPDNSGDILDEFAALDSRFIVLHQINQGVSSARNAGLSQARGEWVTFIDGDDTVESDMLETLASHISQGNADIYCWGISKDFYENGRLVNTETRLPSTEVMITYPSLGEHWRYMLSSLDMESSCNKLYRASLIRKHHLKFNEGAVIFEDFQFVLDYISLARPSVALLKHTFYHYRSFLGENTAGKRSRYNLVVDIATLIEKLLQMEGILAIPEADVQTLRCHAMQKINVVFAGLKGRSYKEHKQVFADFLESPLMSYSNHFNLCGRYVCLICKLVSHRQFLLTHVILKLGNI